MLGLILPLLVSEVEHSRHQPRHYQHHQQAHRHEELRPRGDGGRQWGGGGVDWFTAIIFFIILLLQSDLAELTL